MLLLQCCALLNFRVLDGQSMCNYMQITSHRALLIRLGSVHSIHPQWESKRSWLHTCSTCTCVIATWAQLFEERLALNVRLNLTEVSFSCVQKHLLGQFSLLFLQLPIINLYTKRITCKAEMLFKASYLNSNLAPSLGYLNPALNNSALEIRIAGSSCCPQLHVPLQLLLQFMCVHITFVTLHFINNLFLTINVVAYTTAQYLRCANKLKTQIALDHNKVCS